MTMQVYSCIQEVAGLREEDILSEAATDPFTAAVSDRNPSRTLSESQYSIVVHVVYTLLYSY